MQRLAATLARNSIRRQVIHKMDRHKVRMSIKKMYEEPPGENADPHQGRVATGEGEKWR